MNRSLSSKSPSFTAQQQESSEDLADIAARVVNELKLNSPFDDEDEDVVYINDDHVNDESEDDSDDDDDDSEFEFAVLTNEETSSPISADEIFSNGQIKPLYYYPVFGTDLRSRNEKSPTLRLPLRKLLSEERCKNGEEGLEGVPTGTYCVWAPKKKGHDDVMEKKSRSTGSSSSKRWRFRDLLPRSNSDGKDTFVFLTPMPTTTTTTSDQAAAGKRKEKGVNVGNGGMRRKSYLPYRQDLVGLFASVNGISRTVRPF